YFRKFRLAVKMTEVQVFQKLNQEMTTLLMPFWSLYHPLTRKQYDLFLPTLKKHLEGEMGPTTSEWEGHWENFHQLILKGSDEFIWRRSYPEFVLLISERGDDWSPMLLPPETRMKLEVSLLGSAHLSPASQASFSSTPFTMATTSTSSTIAPFLMEPVGAAGGSNLGSLLPLGDDWEENPFLSGTLAKPPGTISSHITSFNRRYKDQRFSLEEQSPPFRFRLQMYDTAELDTPANWWKHKSLEMDVGYVENSPLQKTLQRIVNYCWKDYSADIGRI
ncbi:hypothetical protein JTE90_023990, partial [Oedothorax gibbosus]